MITIHKTDTGAVIPWEYMAAKAGTYKAGQGLNVTDGLLQDVDSNLKPSYLCMAEITVKAGETVPVTRINKNAVYEATCNAGEELHVGQKVGLEDGYMLTAALDNAFEITEIVDQIISPAIIRGRFI